MDDAHRTPLLVFVFILKRLKPIVQCLCRFTIHFGGVWVHPGQQGPSLAEKLGRFHPSFALARDGPPRHPDGERGQPPRAAKPLLQDGQSGKVCVAALRDIASNFQQLFTEVVQAF